MLPTGTQKAFADLIGLFFVQGFAEALLSRFATPGADAVLDVSAAYVAWAAAAFLAHRYLLFPRNLWSLHEQGWREKPPSVLLLCFRAAPTAGSERPYRNPPIPRCQQEFCQGFGPHRVGARDEAGAELRRGRSCRCPMQGCCYSVLSASYPETTSRSSSVIDACRN